MNPTRRPALRLALALASATFVFAAGLGSPHAAEAKPPAPPPASDPLIQMAILLDTSSSMDGLIDQARQQLWRVVNELSRARQDGSRPILQLAVYEYGNDGLKAKDGYIRQVQAFTGDLDLVSEKLFALKTNGGSEFCGQVIETSLKELAWSRRKDALRLIYIAGNEEFTQGPVKFQKAISAAKESGILVNTIHCGPSEVGARDKWGEAAALAGGEYLTIDQNRAVVHIKTPQDAEIAKLGVELNETYIYYGRRGRSSAMRQQKQDETNAAYGVGNSVQRAVSKSSGYYDNSGWDLIDAVNKKKAKIEDVDKDTLPEELKGLTDAELKTEVARREAKRAELQQRIEKLNTEREAFVAAEKKKQGEGEANTLDAVVVKSLRKQAAAKNFRFE